jgi:hypothetical protein
MIIWQETWEKAEILVAIDTRDMAEGTLRTILREAGIDPEKILRT